MLRNPRNDTRRKTNRTCEPVQLRERLLQVIRSWTEYAWFCQEVPKCLHRWNFRMLQRNFPRHSALRRNLSVAIERSVVAEKNEWPPPLRKAQQIDISSFCFHSQRKERTPQQQAETTVCLRIRTERSTQTSTQRTKRRHKKIHERYRCFVWHTSLAELLLLVWLHTICRSQGKYRDGKKHPECSDSERRQKQRHGSYPLLFWEHQ